MILIILLFLFSFSALAGAPNCPDYTPGLLTPMPYAASWQFGGISGWGRSADEACQVMYNSVKAAYPTYNVSGAYVSNGKCVVQKDGADWVGGSNIVPSCPAGYSSTGTGSCSLVNASQINNNVVCTYQPPPCASGESVGFGAASGALVCYEGCEIKTRGMTAHELDNAGTAIGIKVSEWEKTGSTCNVGGSDPVANSIDPSKPNCVTNGARQLCVSASKPGCGLVNGVEWCPDQVGCGYINGQRVCVPDDGGCQPVGGGDYACTKGASPPPGIHGEPNPIPDFKGTIPVQDTPAPAGGNPPTAAVPNSGGTDAGGQTSVEIGHYPGSSGNGTGGGGSGSGGGGNQPIDTSGLAQESTMQGISGLLGNIKDSVAGTFTGSAFSTGSFSDHDDVNLDPEIVSKQDEISGRISSIKTEFQTLINFGGSSSGGPLQCPVTSGFDFLGSHINLCTQSLLASTATIGNVLIFLAFVIALYIILS